VSVSAWAQTFDLSISPTQYNQFNIENFVHLNGAAIGSLSTEVTYTLGDTVISVEPQIQTSPNNEPPPFPSDAWVPIEVATTAGEWAVRVIATDTDQSVRIYGPATLSIIEVVPSDEPTFSVPEVVVGEAETAAGGHVTFDVGGAGCSAASGSFFSMGLTTVSCSLGSQSGSFAVVVTDTVPPVISGVPASFTTLSHTPTYTNPTATDAIDGAIPAANIFCEPASGSTFPDGPTEVQCAASDEHANFSYGSFTITVITVPILHLPDNIVAEATSAAGKVVNYTATADGADTFQCSPASGSTFPLGTTTVNCSAMNAAGTSTGSFTVTVQDTTAPTIVNIDGTPREVLWPNNHKMQNTTVVVTATDAVDAHPTAHIVSVTSDQPVNDGGDGDTSPDWLITGALTVQLRSERSSGQDRHYTITVAVTDFSGNTSTGTLVISVHP
jgi:hypothetical protein